MRAGVGPPRLRVIAWLLALGSVVAMGVLSLTAAPLRVVYGTDTRAAGLLIGAGLALAFPPAAWAVRASGARARRLRVLGLLVRDADVDMDPVAPLPHDFHLLHVHRRTKTARGRDLRCIRHPRCVPQRPDRTRR